MLNEMIEYRQYTDREKAQTEGRLKYAGIISNSLSGTERALVIIARHFLFDEAYSSLKRNERIELAAEAMRIWCGFRKAEALPKKKKSAKEETPEKEEKPVEKETAESSGITCPEPLANWMPDYIKKVFIEEKLAALKKKIKEKSGESGCVKMYIDKLKKIVKDLPESEDGLKEYRALKSEFKAWEADAIEKCGRNNKALNAVIYAEKMVVNTINAWSNLKAREAPYHRALFTDDMPKEELSVNNNDSKTIICKRIIADALDMGPLERYYLACEESALQAISNRSKHEQDLILKATSAYLLEKRNIDTEQDYVYVNLTDIANWIVKSLSSKKLELENVLLPSMSKADGGNGAENGQQGGKTSPMFRKKKIGGNSVIMWVDPTWLCKFMLVREKELAEWKEEHSDGKWTYLSDPGSTGYLQKNTEYDAERK